MDDNSLLPKEEIENELICSSKEGENNEIIPLEKKEIDDPIQSNEKVKRMKQLVNHELGQLED